ncbi:MAG TPA: MarR family transcriptional regulator [Candidatus Saccharimonadales bacterium]|nr:MarR family transcriptional regulator [Candidatus Saccharimonadales bacterium]
MRLRLEETYLYKLHLLTGQLDKLFDSSLRTGAGIGLSHFLVLLAVRQHGAVSSKDVADFLAVSPPAVSRQIEIAERKGWVSVRALNTDKRGHSIQLTQQGEAKLIKSLRVLEKRVFPVFSDSECHLDLMSHIDMLLTNVEERGR